MLFIQTSKVKYSTLGAMFTVTFSVEPNEIGYLNELHDKYAEANMKGFILETKTEPQTDDTVEIR